MGCGPSVPVKGQPPPAWLMHAAGQRPADAEFFTPGGRYRTEYRDRGRGWQGKKDKYYKPKKISAAGAGEDEEAEHRGGGFVYPPAGGGGGGGGAGGRRGRPVMVRGRGQAPQVQRAGGGPRRGPGPAAAPGGRAGNAPVVRDLGTGTITPATPPVVQLRGPGVPRAPAGVRVPPGVGARQPPPVRGRAQPAAGGWGPNNVVPPAGAMGTNTPERAERNGSQASSNRSSQNGGNARRQSQNSNRGSQNSGGARQRQSSSSSGAGSRNSSQARSVPDTHRGSVRRTSRPPAPQFAVGSQGVSHHPSVLEEEEEQDEPLPAAAANPAIPGSRLPSRCPSEAGARRASDAAPAARRQSQRPSSRHSSQGRGGGVPEGLPPSYRSRLPSG